MSKTIKCEDLKFTIYVEDTDFGWRALLHGLNSYFVPKVIVFHKNREEELCVYAVPSSLA